MRDRLRSAGPPRRGQLLEAAGVLRPALPGLAGLVLRGRRHHGLGGLAGLGLTRLVFGLDRLRLGARGAGLGLVLVQVALLVLAPGPAVARIVAAQRARLFGHVFTSLEATLLRSGPAREAEGQARTEEQTLVGRHHRTGGEPELG